MAWIILFVIIVFVIAIIKSPGGTYVLPVSPKTPPKYKKRDTVMNSSERQLYLFLQKQLGDKYIILAKVRIEDFIDILEKRVTWGELQSLRGKIKSRHVDFLICNLAVTEPLLAIELDGFSHNKVERIERDNFITKLYKEAGLPLKRIRVGDNFNEKVNEIQKMLNRE